MPILEVTLVLKDGEVLPSSLAADIADAASLIFGSAPGGTWVRLTSLSPDHYAENGGGPPVGVAPVFVSVLKAELQPLDALRGEADRLTKAVALATKRPPINVHVLFEAPAKGRVSFGGNLLT